MNSESELHSKELVRTPQTQGSLTHYQTIMFQGLEGLIFLGCQRSTYLFITTDRMSERTHWLLYNEQYIKNVTKPYD